ncbi:MULTISPECIES: hypothetical protein [Streptomyces]|uniref:hypothetical protein n=1 Tax=Streptomyces TaxID=1883 RepID=UPI0011656854|nr:MULTISPECIES: hypothetical protein [Streptomyces]MCX4614771.1 hypothetical protein [Streptomyces mirabilis]NMI55649.1 hypothetical protein [Streptomyces sp. RLA2-12]QDN55147.1 hypothetical protein FNV67_07060 [Streptomyces sp. S1D4-20]QDN65326.1 hypothetical protein FNV66_06660 [Streptomyces sp. S1D4-14]QDN85345.1 hypothetical protein FNV61_06450 [Streptomyces sp. RLB3-6]
MAMEQVREGARLGAWAVAGVIGLAVLYVIGAFAFGAAGWITAPFRGEADKRENTVGSGEFRQTTYEEFFDLCEAVQNAEGTIQVLQEERKTASETRTTQIDQSITALKASRIESVNDYNSKAAQEHRAPFRDKDLPYRLDAGAERTTCTN